MVKKRGIILFSIIIIVLIMIVSFASSFINVTLNSPANNYSDTIFENITFNSTSQGDVIVNMSLWNNFSGSWDLDELIIYTDRNSTSGETFPSTYTGQFAKAGVKVTSGSDITGIKKVIMATGSNPSYCYIYDSTGSTQLVNGTFNGLTCEFSEIFYTSPSTQYWVVVDNVGSSYVLKYKSGISYPYSSNGLSWILGSANFPATTTSNDIYGIDFIETTNQTNISTQTFSRFVNGTYIWNFQTCNATGSCFFAPQNYTLTNVPTHVILNHPLDEEIIYDYDNLIFNASLLSSFGETIENISLYLMEGGGDWILNETLEKEGGTIYNPDSFSNPTNAFDYNDSTYANKTNPTGTQGATTLVKFGKQFDNTFVDEVNYKFSGEIILYRPALGTDSWSWNIKLQTYDGATWNDVTTLDSGSGSTGNFDGDLQVDSYNLDDSYLINDSIQGIRLYLTINKGQYEHSVTRIYSIESVYDFPENLDSYVSSFTKNITDGTIWNIEMCQSDGQCFMQDTNWSVPYLTLYPQTWTFINPQLNLQTKWVNSLVTKIRGLSVDKLANLSIMTDTLALPSTIRVTDSSGNILNHTFNASTGYVNWSAYVPGGNQTALLSDFFNVQYYTDNITLTNTSTTRLIGGNANIVHNITIDSKSSRTMTDVYSFFDFDDFGIVTSDLIKCNATGSCTEDITDRDDVAFFDEDNDGSFDRIEWFVEELSNQTYELRNLIGSPIQISQDIEILNKPIEAFDNVEWENTISIYNPNTFEVETSLKVELPLGSTKITLDDISKNLQFDENGLLEPYISIIDKNDPSHKTSIFLLPGETKTFSLKYTTDSVTITSSTEFPIYYLVDEMAEINRILRIKNQADYEVTDLEFLIPIDFAEDLIVCEGEFRNGCPDEDDSDFDETNLDTKKTVKGEYKLQLDSIDSSEVKEITLTYFVPTVEIDTSITGNRNINGTIYRFNKFVFKSIAPFKLDDVRQRIDVDFDDIVEVRECESENFFLCEDSLEVTEQSVLKLGVFEVGDTKAVIIWSLENETKEEKLTESVLKQIFSLGQEFPIERGTVMFYIFGLFADENVDGTLSIRLGKIIFIGFVILVSILILILISKIRRRKALNK